MLMLMLMADAVKGWEAVIFGSGWPLCFDSTFEAVWLESVDPAVLGFI